MTLIIIELVAVAALFFAGIAQLSDNQNKSYLLTVGYIIVAIGFAGHAVGYKEIHTCMCISTGAICVGLGEYLRNTGKENKVSDRFDKIGKTTEKESLKSIAKSSK